MTRQFLKYWSGYHGILRTIPQAVVVNKAQALAQQRECQKSIRTKLKSNVDKFILFIGRLRSVKDPQFTLQSFLDFLTLNPISLDFLFIGSVDEHCDEINSFLTRVATLPRVHWLESIPQTQVHSLMTVAECLVNSSRSEGQPLSVMEAMALGCPVIARNIPGNLGLIEHGNTGLIYETQEDFRRCLEQVLFDETLRATIVRNAADKMQRPEYQPQNEAAAYLKLLRDLQA